MTEHYLDRLARTIRDNWDQSALTDFYLTDEGTAQDTTRGNHYTYGEMYCQMMRLGELFRALGLKKGDHIAICGSNSANWAVAYLAIAAYQGVVVTVLHSQSTEDIARQIDFSDAVALFTDRDIWDELREQHLLQIKHVISLEDFSILHSVDAGAVYGPESATDALPLRYPCANDTVIIPHGEPDDLAMICFTSGSTSTSKGIMLSNRNMNNNAKNITDGYPDDETEVFLSVLPMAHIYGFMTEILAQLLKGKHVYVLSSIITTDSLYNAISLTKPYALRLIPFMLSGLMHAHQDCISRLKTCKQIYIGGSLFDEQIEEKLLKNQVPISIGYGQTETGPLISYSVCSQYKQGTCGKIVEGMTALISRSGEILVKGENVMLGYYKNPEATAEKIDKDGWLHTGDAGWMDKDGYLYVTGRIRHDLIVLPNGENIHPEDIERKINALPEVSESIVLAREGKLVAIVVPATPLALGEGQGVRLSVLDAINSQLPLYSQLYDVECLSEPLQKTEKQTIKRYLYR